MLSALQPLPYATLPWTRATRSSSVYWFAIFSSWFLCGKINQKMYIWAGEGQKDEWKTTSEGAWFARDQYCKQELYRTKEECTAQDWKEWRLWSWTCWRTGGLKKRKKRTLKKIMIMIFFKFCCISCCVFVSKCSVIYKVKNCKFKLFTGAHPRLTKTRVFWTVVEYGKSCFRDFLIQVNKFWIAP